MKYRITRARRTDNFLPFPKRYRHAAAHTLRRMSRKAGRTEEPDPIDLSHLFEISDLPDLPKAGADRPSLLMQLRRALRAILSPLCYLFRRFFSIFRRPHSSKKERAKSNAILAGALCASLAVLVLSAAVVLLSLTAPYGGSYVSVTVPSLVGTAYDTLPVNENFSYIITYEQNPDVPSGHIISQSPSPGVTRRLYVRDGTCVLRLAVSRQASPYTLISFLGLPSRDAILELRNHGVPYRLSEAYSDEAEAGTVLFSEPRAGSVWDGETPVTLTVSKGPRVLYASVPTLVNLSEMEAETLLRAAGLSIGQVTYLSSEQPVGTVLSQSIAARERVPLGSAIDVTVSAGRIFTDKTVPSLYGMTRAEAEATLHRYGLVLGTVSGGGSTVVSQSPAPHTPITSAIVSVDIHLAT